MASDVQKQRKSGTKENTGNDTNGSKPGEGDQNNSVGGDGNKPGGGPSEGNQNNSSGGGGNKPGGGANGEGSAGSTPEKPGGSEENGGNEKVTTETTTSSSTTTTPYFALSAVSLLISLALKI
nr:hypothetical transcript [Hymenolepis microstoma]